MRNVQGISSAKFRKIILCVFNSKIVNCEFDNCLFENFESAYEHQTADMEPVT